MVECQELMRQIFTKKACIRIQSLKTVSHAQQDKKHFSIFL